ncbi:MAG: SDR family NAD(P)-dependent oxidoreductase [Bacteroidales bacterium]
MTQSKKAILVTGANGGLGSALVEISHELPGIDFIIATDIQEEIQIKYKDNPKVIGLVMDVRSENSIKKVRDYLHEMRFTIKYLVNCAGIARFFPISESSEKLLDNTIKVNTYGPILTVSIFLDDLIKTQGRVIQISSVSVKLPTLFQPYPNSKIALEAFSSSMKQELALHGVKLVLIRPGAINTNLVEEMKTITNPITDSKFDNKFKKFTKIAQSDIGKMVEPAEVANLVKKVLLIKNPRRIYSINKNAKISILNLFPHSWVEYFIYNTFK